MKFQYYKPTVPAHLTHLDLFFTTSEQTKIFKSNLLMLWDKHTDRLLIALKGKKIIGVAWLRKDKDMTYIKYIHVNTPFMGIGREMIKYLMDEYQVLECRAVYEANGFWRKLGFLPKDNYGAMVFSPPIAS